MNTDQQKKLQSHYHSLLEQKQFLDRLKGGTNVKGSQIRPLVLEFHLIKKDFPDMVPFDPEYNEITNEKFYDFIAVRGYLSMVIGRLEVAVSRQTDIPVTEKRQFSFIMNTDLKAIIERDYEEIQRAFLTNC